MAANASDLILKIFVFGMILAQLFNMDDKSDALEKKTITSRN